jgi:hypothetical protein
VVADIKEEGTEGKQAEDRGTVKFFPESDQIGEKNIKLDDEGNKIIIVISPAEEDIEEDVLEGQRLPFKNPRPNHEQEIDKKNPDKKFAVVPFQSDGTPASHRQQVTGRDEKEGYGKIKGAADIPAVRGKVGGMNKDHPDNAHSFECIKQADSLLYTV